MNASAWNTMYLNCEDNNWGQGSSLPFNWLDTNSYYYILSPDHITSGDFYFRFYVSWDDNTGGEHVAPVTDGEEITVEVNTNVNRGSEVGSFKLAQSPNAKFVVIYIYWDNNTWNLYSQVITETATVAFVDVDNNWAAAKVYAWLPNGIKLMGDWPGTAMTNESNIYTCEVPYVAGAKVKFTDKNEGGNESSDFDLEQNSIYKYNAKVESVSATVSSVGYATFSSPYPLDFTNVTAVTPYRATVSNDKVVLTKVTGKVPARTGLLLAAENGATVSVPTTISTASIGDNKLVATVTETSVAANANNYMLANGTNGVGFYSVDAATNSGAGKAYLHTDAALANENNTARVAWTFQDNTTTAIESVQQTTGAQQYYDMLGRRVAQPTKGLYIVNGKKVIK